MAQATNSAPLTPTTTSTTTTTRATRIDGLIVISTGCPCSIGPEISVRSAAKLQGAAVLVGDPDVLRAAAKLVGVAEASLQVLEHGVPLPEHLDEGLYVYPSGPELSGADREPGKPTQTSGRAQLDYVEDAYRLAVESSAALVTAAVSKAAIASSGAPAASSFTGHTEWLQRLDGADEVTMCFIGKRLSSSLVTTHLPLARVSQAITSARVATATVHLAQALIQRGDATPRVVVCSLNPHAGEDGLLGGEEQSHILPGVQLAQERLGDSAEVVGPIGAETAFRYAARGDFAGVVAMYHDQATIPMKLLDFGDAVNLTMGLRRIRTSVDHGTAYDIAWQGRADDRGMLAALALAQRLSG